MFRIPIALSVLIASAFTLSAQETSRSFIDAQIQSGWKTKVITPAPLCDDATFLRRVHLDLVGTIPKADEARAFLADNDPKKREKLVDRLLADPRFGTAQADVWDVILFGRHPSGSDAIRKRDNLKKWLAQKFNDNQPYDKWVRELMLAEAEGTELFYAQFRSQPEDATVAVSRIFLGTQLQCARCHDHPYENWTQRDFYGMAGFFVRLNVVDDANGKKFRIVEKRTGEVLFSGDVKEQKPGRKGEPVAAKFLGGKVLDEPVVAKDFKEPDLKTLPKPNFSRKEKFADWLVSNENPYFARAAVNRLWAQFMGRGIVHPIDDLSEKNEPSHPELLDRLKRDFIASKFDLKKLLRELVLSETYQRSGSGPTKDALPTAFERARVRPLSAEEMLASIRIATGTEATPNNNPVEYFLRYFGEPTNGIGDFQASLNEHLFLNNSDQIRQMITRRKGNLAETLLTSKEPWEAKVDLLFLSVLSRMPRGEERSKFIAHFKSMGKPEQMVEEAIWVLLNTSEFRFNH